MGLRHVLDPASWEGSEDSEQLRRRALAAAGVWFLLAGFLAALGLGLVLFASFALLLLGGIGIGALWLVRRSALGPRLRDAAGVVRTRTSQLRQREPAAAGLERRARRLNELGAQLRRAGNHTEAAEQHRAALEILRELGDRQAEALTLNNLALALVHTTGGVPLAIQHFEEAARTLHELGDDEHEGQVLANLAFVRRRQGRDEDAANLLHAALDKLPPGSSAYHQVEAELRRAS